MFSWLDAPLAARLDRIDERGYGALKAYTTRE